MMEDGNLRSNEKVNGQIDYQTRKIISPQTNVNFKKENSNPLDQNCSSYSLKGYERQASYKSNQFDQNRQTGEQLKMASNNNPYLKQSVYNNNEQEQGKPFIRAYQEGDQRKPLDQVNYKQEQRQTNERDITNPYGNPDNIKRDPIGTKTPYDPKANMNVYTPQSRQDNYHRDAQQSEQKREFQQPEYKRMYPDQDTRIPQRQMSSFEIKQKPVDQGDRVRYDNERIRTLGGQQEQPERMDRLIRASDYVKKQDNNDFFQQQDKTVLVRREFIQRDGVDQGLYDYRNTSKSQEYSQRQQNQIRRPQEGSKTPIEGRINEKRGFDNQSQQDGRYNLQQNPYPYQEGRTQQQQFYDIQPSLDNQRRMPNPYDERRNVNPYEPRPQIQDQRPPLERRPDKVELEKRPERPEFGEHPEFERRPDFQNRSPFQVRFGQEERYEIDQRLHPEGHQWQGQNYERFQQQGYRQAMDGKYQYEGRQPQKTQFYEHPSYGPDQQQEVREGMNQRKFSDCRSIQGGYLEGRPGQMDGRCGLPEGRFVLPEGRPGQMDGRFKLPEGRIGQMEGRFGLPEGRPGLMDERFGLPEGRPGLIERRLMEGKQQLIDGRGGFNRTYGEDQYQGTSILEGKIGLDGCREQVGTRPPISSKEQQGTFEQRIPIENNNQYQRGYDDKFGNRQFEQQYSQQQDIIGRKDFGRPEYGKMREEFDRRNIYGRPGMEDKMQEFGIRKEFDGRIRPETSFGKPNGIAQQPEEMYLRREYNDQGQRLNYYEDNSVIDRLGLERGTNKKIIGNQAAENMLRGGEQMNRQYDKDKRFNRLGMGERMVSFKKMGYQRTAFQDREEYQDYVKSKLMVKSSLENDQNEFQRKKSQGQGFQKLQSPKGQVETKVGIYDIQRRDGRI